MFETTQTSRQPATLRVTDAIPGWVEGLQLMRAGEKRRFWIPGSLAYDSNPNPELPKGMLVFDIELVRIQ
jgi:peptidylprolyl isomerase